MNYSSQELESSPRQSAYNTRIYPHQYTALQLQQQQQQSNILHLNGNDLVAIKREAEAQVYSKLTIRDHFRIVFFYISFSTHCAHLCDSRGDVLLVYRDVSSLLCFNAAARKEASPFIVEYIILSKARYMYQRYIRLHTRGVRLLCVCACIWIVGE